MTSEWTEVSLEDIADLNGGYAFKSEEYTETGHFVLRTVNITDDGRICQDGAAYVSPASAKKYERFLLKDLDTLFVMVGATLGKTGLVKAEDLPALLNQNMWLVRAKPDRVDPLFLHYAFKVISRPMCSLASGSARGFVKRDDFRQMKVRVPAIGVQRKISDLLGTFDDRITLLRETNTTFEAIAQALFKSWFVDFDPVYAKMQGRPPEGMIDATAALFPDSFEESELGAVPKGWRVMPVGDVVETVGGATPDTKTPAYWEPADHHWTTPKDLSGVASPVLLGTERKLSDAGLKKISSGLLPVGSLLMSSRAPIGYLAMTQVPMAINQGYIAIPPGGKLSPLYMLFWCQTNMDSIKGRANGSTFMEISKKAFRPIPALVPSQAVLDAFEAVTTQLFARLVENEKQAQSLASIRDALLPRLISGQLSLSEAQGIVEPA
jgi:type I restriction enzyme S subunit